MFHLHRRSNRLATLPSLILLGALLALPSALAAHEPDFTEDFNRDGCTFVTSGATPYFPLWVGYSLTLEGEVEDEGEILEVTSINTVLPETERVDRVLTRVYEERELEDGELVEVSRNFVALCRETGDLWYFGEDVDDYEDGEIVGHEGAWRAGVNGAQPGVLLPGSPMIGARYFEEMAPGVALDRGEIVAMGEEVTVPVGTFTNTIMTVGTSGLDPEAADEKSYAYMVGNVVDEELELVEITLPSCLPDATTLCLNDGRFRVSAEWADFEGNEGDATAFQVSDESGELYFFTTDNVELLVKVLDGCSYNNSYWVFAAGLTNVEVTLTVTDTQAGMTQVYDNPLSRPFEPILDTSAFMTCP
jgi:hypothetical protein